MLGYPAATTWALTGATQTKKDLTQLIKPMHTFGLRIIYVASAGR